MNRDPAGYPYELYDVTKDWTQYEDVAAKYPDKLKELEKLFWVEATNTRSRRSTPPLRRASLRRVRTSLLSSPGEAKSPGRPMAMRRVFSTRHSTLRPMSRSEAFGMIVTQGGRFGGYGFYVKPVFLYNFGDLQRTRGEGPNALSPGRHTLEFDFQYDGLGMGTLAFNNVSGIGRGGMGVHKFDRKEVARQTMEHTVPLIWQWDENSDIGADTGTPVSND